MKDIVIFGTGDFAQVARVYFDRDSEYRVVAFTVDEPYVGNGRLDGLPIVAFEHLGESHPRESHAMFVAIGFSRVNRARAGVYERCRSAGYELVSYVNSKTSVFGDLEVGDNCFVFEENVIQPFVRLGNDVILWSGNHIGHDATIEDHCFITSHVVVSGHVRIGTRSFIGVNATLRNSITIAPETLIGAGAIIMKDTKAKEVYMPERAKRFVKSSDEIDL